MDGDPQGGPPVRQRFEIPLTIAIVALFVMVAFQAVQLVRERGNLAAIRIAQEPTVQEGLKLRRTLDSLASNTAKLAEAGDAGAKAVVESMRKQGISLNAPH